MNSLMHQTAIQLTSGPSTRGSKHRKSGTARASTGCRTSTGKMECWWLRQLTGVVRKQLYMKTALRSNGMGSTPKNWNTKTCNQVSLEGGTSTRHQSNTIRSSKGTNTGPTLIGSTRLCSSVLTIEFKLRTHIECYKTIWSRNRSHSSSQTTTNSCPCTNVTR